MVINMENVKIFRSFINVCGMRTGAHKKWVIFKVVENIKFLRAVKTNKFQNFR